MVEDDKRREGLTNMSLKYLALDEYGVGASF